MHIDDLNDHLPGFHFLKLESFNKGWSDDQKYIVTTRDDKYLLRLSSIDRIEDIQLQINLVEQCMDLGLPVQQLVSHGDYHNHYCLLYQWIEGHEAKEILPTLTSEEQYELGLEAGRILKVIHAIPGANQFGWRDFFLKKIERKKSMYLNCEYKYDNDQCLFNVIEKYENRIIDKPVVYHHGDYHVGNMVIDEKGKLWIIDFDRCSIGVPFEEFNRISWCVNTSEVFSRGRVDGYFDGKVHKTFWEVLSVYIATNILSSLPWAVQFGVKEI
ncbi:phosphotransferase [Macrococcus psychrotolerans]|uniref:Phosphotransferase n=1 Tax=Macrococcus psychrotolerans TaxID=3039389 RepID=A0AAT9P9T3_9STAP|nr:MULTISPECIES: phosphotransferase [Macrococcus]QYA33826.1 phosphotransferase [Macrococcus sp. 19Msa1099]QYA38647.1 phosphotransferase [Macrococcus caseolyticus]QYA77354.1 phosphotransferase [Macrococcus caseolyticus]